jgi:hypothetical protein
VPAQLQLDGRCEPAQREAVAVGPKNDVAGRFVSAAIACIVSSSSGSPRRQTPAGFPPNGCRVNAST